MLRYLRQICLALCVATVPVAYADMMAPDQVVKQIAQETYQFVNQDNGLQKGDTTKLIEWADKSVLPNFDFNRMTSLAVGKDWRQATPEQKKQLTQEFRRLLTHTFANAFIGIDKNQKIEYKPFKMNPDEDQAAVKILVIKPSTKPLDLTFWLEKGVDSWKVYDIVLAGVSLITNYRDSFTEEIRTNGVDGLIKVLVEKNRQLEQKAKAS